MLVKAKISVYCEGYDLTAGEEYDIPDNVVAALGDSCVEVIGGKKTSKTPKDNQGDGKGSGERSYTELKEKAKELGLSFSGNIKGEDLKALVEEAEAKAINNPPQDKMIGNAPEQK